MDCRAWITFNELPAKNNFKIRCPSSSVCKKSRNRCGPKPKARAGHDRDSKKPIYSHSRDPNESGVRRTSWSFEHHATRPSEPLSIIIFPLSYLSWKVLDLALHNVDVFKYRFFSQVWQGTICSMLSEDSNYLFILPPSFVLANSMRSEEQNQGRAFLSEPKGSLYFVRNGAYLIATQEKEPHSVKHYILGIPPVLGEGPK